MSCPIATESSSSGNERRISDWMQSPLRQLVFSTDGSKALGPLRHRVFLTALSLASLGMLTGLVLRMINGRTTTFDKVVYLVAAAFFGYLAVVLWQRKQTLSVVEQTAYVRAVALFLTRTGQAVLAVDTSQLNFPSELMGSAYWIFAIYVLSFLVFDAHRGLILSGAIYTTVVAFSVYRLAIRGTAGTQSLVLFAHLQLLMSSMVVIALLYPFTWYKELIAYTDFLTGVPNRRRLYELLEEELARAERYARPLTVVMFDLKGFKQVNDAFGHDAGDKALQEVAHLVQRSIRQADHFGRWGGDEFLVIAPEMGPEKAQHLIRRLRRIVQRCPIPNVGTLDASFGLGFHRDGDTPASLVKRADSGLYENQEDRRAA